MASQSFNMSIKNLNGIGAFESLFEKQCFRAMPTVWIVACKRL